jgi:hypothetical protein
MCFQKRIQQVDRDLRMTLTNTRSNGFVSKGRISTFSLIGPISFLLVFRKPGVGWALKLRSVCPAPDI